MSSKTNLVLTYFHGVIGPKIILSFPEEIPQNIGSVIKGFFDVDVENPFFEVTLLDDNLKITNLYFELPSEWARGGKEMIMISVITPKESNTEYFYDLLREASTKIKTSINIYKSLYKDDAVSRKDGECGEKYDELRNIVTTCLTDLKEQKREAKIRELLTSRGLSLVGAFRVFGDIVPGMISCLLQQKSILLCGDTDASAALFSILHRIFLDIISLDDKIVIKKKCKGSEPDTLVIDTSLKLIESGSITDDALDAIKRYLHEAEKIADDNAGIILLRQKISILLKTAKFLEKTLKKKKSEKAIIKSIQSQLRIKIRNDELLAVSVFLKARGKEDIVENIIFSKLSKF